MGFFDALFGTNTTQNSANATNGANSDLSSSRDTNYNTLVNSATNAGGFLDQGRRDANGKLSNAYWQSRGDLQDYNGRAVNALQGGVNAGVDTLRGSNGNFAPWLANGQRANGTLADALGINGAGGNAAATDAFHAGPGYQFQVDQASDNAARKAASLGIAGSGNTLDAITRLSSNLANNEYGGWLDRLNGLSGQGLTAANAINQNNTGIAGLQAAGGQGTANLYGTLGSQFGNLDTSFGNAQAGLDTNYANSLAGIQTSLGNSLVNNQWHGADAIAGNTINYGKQADSAENANNGIFSGLLGKGLSIGAGLLGL